MEEVLAKDSVHNEIFSRSSIFARVREDTSLAIFNQGEHNSTTSTNNKRRVMVLVMNMAFHHGIKRLSWMQLWFQLAMNYYGAR